VRQALTPVAWRGGWTLAAALPLAFLAIFFAWPVIAMVGRGLADANLGEVLTAPRTYRVIAQTLGQALAGTLGAVLLGLPGAYILYCRTFPGRRVVRALATIPFVLPTVVVGMAFRSLLSIGGPLGFLGFDQSITAVILALVFFNYSVIIRTVGPVWAGLDSRHVAAARTLGASPFRAFLTVTLPMLAPAIAAGAAVVFLFCTTSYGLVRTLGTPGYGTVETEIWIQTSRFLNLGTAAALSIVQVLMVIVVLVLAEYLRRKTQRAMTLRAPAPRRLGWSDWLPASVTFATVGILMAAPLVSLIPRSLSTRSGWSLDNYRLLATQGEGFSGGTTVVEALTNSLRIATDAALIAIAVGVPLAMVMARPPRTALGARMQGLLDGAVLLPLGVSAVTVGFGMSIALDRPPLDLRSSLLLVPIAQAVVALPLVIRALVPTLRGISPHMREAAATLGASPARILWTIDVPYLLRGLGVAVGFAFATSVGEFGATSFLSRPDMQTLPVIIVRLLSRPGANNLGMAMAGAVILALLTAGVMTIAESLRPRWARESEVTL